MAANKNPSSLGSNARVVSRSPVLGDSKYHGPIITSPTATSVVQLFKGNKPPRKVARGG